MNSNKKIMGMEEMRARLSVLWIVVMLNMVFADILSLFEPGALGELVTGTVDGIQFTSELMLMMAVILEIPIIMIFLSRVLNYKANRIVNIVAVVVTTIFIVAGGSTSPSYIFFAGMEIVCILLIIRNVWKWQTKDV